MGADSMTAGYRRSLGLVCVYLLAVSLTSGATHAQENPSHRLWLSHLSPDQVKAALARLTADEATTNEALEKLIKEYLAKNGTPTDPQKLDEAIRRITGDKQLMEQLRRIARQRSTDPQRPGTPTLEELRRLLATQPGDPTKPPGIPTEIGPLRPNPQADPDPKLLPLEPKNPMPGVLPPDVPPNPGQDDDLDRPSVTPLPVLPGLPAVPARPWGIKPIDEARPPAPEEPGDPRARSLEAFAALWERYIGPLDETPEVKKALFDLLTGDGLDFDLRDEKGNSIWDLLKKGDLSGEGLTDLLNGNSSGWQWNLPQFDWPKLNLRFGADRSGDNSSANSDGSSGSSWWGRNARSDSYRGSGSYWGFGPGGFGSTWLPVVILALVILTVFLWLKYRDLLKRRMVLVAVNGEQMAWPIDPCSITTRQDVVIAFEYLSVRVCGPAARNWTHLTIAEALRDLAKTHAETAGKLARLYELARYAPLDEPLSAPQLLEARTLVCELAGVTR